MTTTTFKITLGAGDMRRVLLELPEDAPLAALRARLAELTPAAATAGLRYLDEEGDLVTIASDADLREAAAHEPVRLSLLADVAPPPAYYADFPADFAADFAAEEGALDAPVPPLPAPDTAADDFVLLDAESSSSSSSDSDSGSDSEGEEDEEGDEEGEGEGEAAGAGAGRQTEPGPFRYPIDMEAARLAGIATASEEQVNEVLRAINAHPAVLFQAGIGDRTRVPREFRHNLRQMLRRGGPPGGFGGPGGPPGGFGGPGGPPGGFGGPGGPPGGFGGPGGPPGGFGGPGPHGHHHGHHHGRHRGPRCHGPRHGHGHGHGHGHAPRGPRFFRLGGMARLVPEAQPSLPVVGAGEQFTVQWTVRNDGASQWPEGVTLVAGNSSAVAPPGETPALLALAPGESGTVSVTFAAPERQGLHFGFWRLRLPGPRGGKRFGQRLTTLFEVVPAGAAADGSEVLRRLAAAGYTDAQQNVELIHRRKGRVSAVIRDLATMNYRAERQAQREAAKAEKRRAKLEKKAAKAAAKEQKRLERARR